MWAWFCEPLSQTHWWMTFCLVFLNNLATLNFKNSTIKNEHNLRQNYDKNTKIIPLCPGTQSHQPSRLRQCLRATRAGFEHRAPVICLSSSPPASTHPQHPHQIFSQAFKSGLQHVFSHVQLPNYFYIFLQVVLADELFLVLPKFDTNLLDTYHVALTNGWKTHPHPHKSYLNNSIAFLFMCTADVSKLNFLSAWTEVPADVYYLCWSRNK